MQYGGENIACLACYYFDSLTEVATFNTKEVFKLSLFEDGVIKLCHVRHALSGRELKRDVQFCPLRDHLGRRGQSDEVCLLDCQVVGPAKLFVSRQKAVSDSCGVCPTDELFRLLREDGGEGDRTVGAVSGHA
ncbi:hypothetical protein A5633_26705 [Mycolicibacterium elephantis]|nr:hypothetical protein A5633_26705 [Mycolicibacterium elephantis]